MKKQLLTWILVCAMVLSLVPSAFAANADAPIYADTAGHWAEEAILRWSELGVLKGSDGKFRADDSISRAELAAIIGRVMGFPASNDNFFSDTAGKWYEGDVSAVALQGIYIVDAGPALGDQALTREEAVEMLYRTFMTDDLFSIRGAPAAFTDMDAVSPDYKTAVEAFRDMRFINGYPDGSFHPGEPFTRAQVVTILNNIIDIYITEPETYDIPEEGNVCVAVPGVTLKGHLVHYVILLPATAEGVTTLDCNIDYGMIWGNHSYRDTETLKLERLGGSSLHFKAVRAGVEGDFAGGAGTAGNPFLIKTEAQLKMLSQYLSKDYKDYHFALANDITLSSGWTPIGLLENAADTDIWDDTIAFCGTLNGNGYAIKNMDIARRGRGVSLYGLFSYLGGTVKNLTISGSVKAESLDLGTPDAMSYTSAGMLAGILAPNGVIDNCRAEAAVSLKGAGVLQAGGIAGVNNGGTIKNCAVNGTLASHGSSVTDNVQAGGIVGHIYTGGHANVSDCSSAADVSVSGGYYNHAGGIGGALLQWGTIERCVASGTISASGALMQNNAGGILGQMEEQSSSMRECASFADIRVSGDPGYFNAAGGLVGSAYTNCSITNSYSAGTIEVDGPASVGGIVGRAECRITVCYTTTKITAPRSFGDLTVNGIVGTIRSFVTVKGCGVLNVDRPHFISYDVANNVETINYVEGRSLSDAATYKELGQLAHSTGGASWNFDTVWTFGDSGYAYPILQKISAELQAIK